MISALVVLNMEKVTAMKKRRKKYQINTYTHVMYCPPNESLRRTEKIALLAIEAVSKLVHKSMRLPNTENLNNI